MNGVDKADAAMNRYRYRHRTYRWTMVISFIFSNFKRQHSELG
jgi:hypothetical protein